MIRHNRGLTYLGSRDTQEADGHEHSSDRHLIISELDTIKVQDAQTVSGNETVKGQNLIHLDSSDESASALSNDVGDWKKVD